MVVRTKNRIKHFLRPRILRSIRLGRDPIPQLVVFRQRGINVVGWETLLNVCPVTPPIASVDADTLAEELADGWDERVVDG